MDSMRLWEKSRIKDGEERSIFRIDFRNHAFDDSDKLCLLQAIGHNEYLIFKSL